MIILLLFLLIIVGVGFIFNKLAEKHKKNRGGYILLGTFTFILGVAIYLLVCMVLWKHLFKINRYLHECLSFISGIIVSMGIYFFLDKKWKD